ncbi:MAG: acetolactate synthase small subunit [Planctomycetota bacterium]
MLTSNRHVLTALVINEPGVLANVAGMFAARGFNIDSLVVGRTENPDISRMTLVVVGDSNVVEQIHKQLAKLVPVQSVRDLNTTDFVERDLALVRVNVDAKGRRELMDLAESFRARVVDVAPDSMLVEIAGTEEKLQAFLDLVEPMGIAEMARTGVIATTRGVQRQRGVGGEVVAKRVRSLDGGPAEALPPS